jgi:hypothetical protein
MAKYASTPTKMRVPGTATAEFPLRAAEAQPRPLCTLSSQTAPCIQLEVQGAEERLRGHRSVTPQELSQLLALLRRRSRHAAQALRPRAAQTGVHASTTG